MKPWTCPNGCGATRNIHWCPIGSTSPPPDRKPVPPEVYFGRPDWDAEASPAGEGPAKAPARPVAAVSVPAPPAPSAETAPRAPEAPGRAEPGRRKRAS